MFRKVRTGAGLADDPLPAAIRRAVEAAVERQWKQFTNEVPFNAKFSEDIIGELYKKEDARAQIFAAFALLAVIIGCLGLFGLAAFTAERRTKEIGIRKVLGARTRDIVRLLVWQFSRPVIIANVIAWPVAWWLMRDWLNGFDERIALDAGAVPAGGGDRARHRDRHGRRPRVQGRPRQPDPRAALRISGSRTQLQRTVMWRNYWTVAVRALAKSRTYSFINIVGLAIGMAACILILLYIRLRAELRQLASGRRRTPTSSRPGTRIRQTASPIFLQMSRLCRPKDAVKKDFPQVEGAVYVAGHGPVFIKDGQASTTKNYLLTDDDFLKVVNLPLVPAPSTARRRRPRC